MAQPNTSRTKLNLAFMGNTFVSGLIALFMLVGTQVLRSAGQRQGWLLFALSINQINQQAVACATLVCNATNVVASANALGLDANGLRKKADRFIADIRRSARELEAEARAARYAKRTL